MKNNQNQIAIMQQQSTVEYLRTLVKNRRANPEELEQAERRLKELQELQDTEPGIGSRAYFPEPKDLKPRDFKTEVLGQRVEHTNAAKTPETLLLGKKIMAEIDALKRRIAEISYSMHMVPEDAACPELMLQAYELKQEEEDLWTKYRFLDRNGHLPEAPKEEEEAKSVELLEALDIRKKLVDKRCKLSAKINDPKNIRSKKLDTWKDDLDQANLDYQYYDNVVKRLKDRL